MSNLKFANLLIGVMISSATFDKAQASPLEAEAQTCPASSNREARIATMPAEPEISSMLHGLGPSGAKVKITCDITPAGYPVNCIASEQTDNSEIFAKAAIDMMYRFTFHPKLVCGTPAAGVFWNVWRKS